MSDETLRTLITCGTTIFVALISNILVFSISKINNKIEKENTFFQKQYEKLYMPIHKILIFDLSRESEKFNKIFDIINANYYLTNSVFREKYEECIRLKKITIAFEDVIITGCICLEDELGYKNTKPNQKQKWLLSNVNQNSYLKKFAFIILNILFASSISYLLIYLNVFLPISIIIVTLLTIAIIFGVTLK